MKKTRLLSQALVLCAAGPLVACSGDKANIGNTNAIGSQLSDYAATWDGYAEAYTFAPDNSDHVRLTIAANGQGTLEVGNQPLVLPATDPNLGYPPSNENPKDTVTPPIWEGVQYPIYGAQVQADRIQVGIKPNDYYASWCALQTPFAYVIETTIGTFDGGPPGKVYTETLVPVDGGAPDASGVMYMACPFQGGGASNPGTPQQMCTGDLNGQQTPVDCGKFYLCTMMVCGCTAGGCTSSPLVAAGSAPSQYPVELDAALDSSGKTMTGTLALSTSLRITVVLTKQ